MVAARHPRPLLRRDAWTSLDGEWLFAVDGDAKWRDPGDVSFGRRITVPFAPETAASGIADRGMYACVWYRRALAIPRVSGGERVLLHFAAVDHEATIWIDGREIARHEGGYTPFTVDVTEFAGGDRDVVVRAYDDPRDLEKPRGKQDWEPDPHAIWYPRTTGIWQTVWLERVPAASIASVRWWCEGPERLRLEVEAAGPAASLTVEYSARGELIGRTRRAVRDGRVSEEFGLQAFGAARAGSLRWSPEHPELIECVLSLTDRAGDVVDRVHSYAALRSITVTGGRLLLNGEAYPLRMALDQGYWEESGLTAPNDAALARDVELTRALGFNGVRKHQKAEDPRWLEHCDRMGLLVFDEMPSPRVFSERAKALLAREWRAIVERDRSHPSVIAWVPFNESWGVPQLDGDAAQVAHVTSVLALTHELDATRPAIGNDGWEWVGGDLVGVHDYAVDPAMLRARYGTRDALEHTLAHERPEKRRLLLAPRRDEPVLLSEFGGLRLTSDEGGWGYANVNADELARRLAELCSAARSDALAGFCYTQLTDTYQERNGLLRMDRSPKADIAELRAAVLGR